MLKQALHYLGRGWSVVPCIPKSKIALVKWAQHQETLPSTDDAERWFSNPNNNIALITGRLSGIVVIDIDPRHGGSLDGHEPTLTVNTPGGGWHLYYEHPGVHVQSNAGVYGPGIDVRGDGGYIMLPPSYVIEKNKDGSVKYEGPYTSGEPHDIMPLPDRFRVRPPEPAQTEENRPCHSSVSEIVAAGVTEGGRNDAIAKIAGSFARGDMAIDMALVSIQALNQTGETIQPPLDPAEVETTVRSVYAGHRRRNKVQDYREVQLAGKPTGDFDVVGYAQYMADNAPSEAQWLIPGWLLRETIALLVAPPESYKTWLEFDMAVSIAGNLPFLNGVMPASTGPVLIIQQEDHPGQNVERISTIQHVREDIPEPKFYPDGTVEIVFPTNLPILFHPDAKLRFGNPKCMNALDKVLEKYRPALTIIDPLYSAVMNTDDYMASAVQDMLILKQWRETYGTTFLLGHHTNKSGSKAKGRERLWGSQFLNGFLDLHIHLWKLDSIPELVIRHGSKREGPEPTVHVKLDISTKDEDLRYNMSCEEITEEQADDLINPPQEGVTKANPRPNLSEMAQRFLSTLKSSGQQDVRFWATSIGVPIVDARKAGLELTKSRRAHVLGSVYRAAHTP